MEGRREKVKRQNLKDRKQIRKTETQTKWARADIRTVVVEQLRKVRNYIADGYCCRFCVTHSRLLAHQQTVKSWPYDGNFKPGCWWVPGCNHDRPNTNNSKELRHQNLRHHTLKCHSCSISQGKGLWGLAGCSLNFTMLFFM